MFSTTTIASSITRPMAAATPPRVIRSKLSPPRYIARNVASTVTGITRTATKVVPQFRRKANRITTEKSNRRVVDGRHDNVVQFLGLDRLAADQGKFELMVLLDQTRRDNNVRVVDRIHYLLD